MVEHPLKRLSALMFTDIVGSVEMQRNVGMDVYVNVIRRHNALFEKSIVEHDPPGEIIQNLGDGFMARFSTSSDAVWVALFFQECIRREEWPAHCDVQVRIGIDQGELIDLEAGADGRHNPVGMAANQASRVADLALAGQILLTRAVFDDARQNVREHPPLPGGDLAAPPALEWPAHGDYRFKGIDEPRGIYEVGASGAAPLRAPEGGEKSWRAVHPDDEETLGWRPGVGLDIPGRSGWVIESKLGSGSFGEVWLGVNQRLGERRAFKFCFDAKRLRSFKRELAIFRLIRDALGKRDDFAGLFDVRVEKPPFYLESEYLPSGNLAQWAESRGGISKVPMETRLDLFCRTARAVAAAHSIGIIHKDIKPSNILIDVSSDKPRPRLSDFGIGALADQEVLGEFDISQSGFTVVGGADSRSGTRLYAPPEAELGAGPSPRGDIFALGVLLYQLVVGDLRRPLATGWRRSVPDEILCEDISQCVDLDPELRFESAEILADRVARLGERRELATREALERAQLEEAKQRATEAERRAARQRALVSYITIFALTVGSVVLFAWLNNRKVNTKLRRVNTELKAQVRVNQLNLYANQMNSADALLSAGNPDAAEIALTAARPAELRGWGWGQLMARVPRVLLAIDVPTQDSRDNSHPFNPETRQEFSRDGRWFVHQEGNTVKIWDVATAEVVQDITLPGRAEVATFSPDGGYLLTSCQSWEEDGNIQNGKTCLWKTSGWEELFEMTEADGWVRNAFLDRGARRLVKLLQPPANAAPEFEAVRICDITRDGNGSPSGVVEVQSLPHRSDHGFAGFAVSPDRRYLAVSTPHLVDEVQIGRYDLTRSHAEALLFGPRQASHFRSISFSPDSSRLITAHGVDPKAASAVGQTIADSGEHRGDPLVGDGSAHIWDVSTGRQVRTLKGHRNVLWGAKFVGNTRAFTYSRDNTAKLWDIDSGDAIKEFTGHGDQIIVGGTGPDGRFAATIDGHRHCRVWDLDSGAAIATFELKRFPALAPVFFPDGRAVAITGSAIRFVGTPRTYSSEVLMEGVRVPTNGAKSSMYGYSYTPDGRVLALALDGGNVIVCDATTGVSPASLKGGSFKAHQGANIGACQFGPDGRYLVTGSRDGETAVWNTDNWEQISLTQEKGRSLARIFFGPAASGGHNAVKIFTNFKHPDAGQGAPGGEIVKFDPAAVADADADPATNPWGELVAEIPGGAGQIELNAAISPDGRLLAVGFYPVLNEKNNSSVHLWDVKKGVHLHQLGGHADVVSYHFSDFGFTADGGRLITLGDGKNAVIWDTGTGKPIATLIAPDGGKIENVAIDPTGQCAAVAYDDGIAALFDGTNGAHLHALSTGAQRVLKVALDPNGKFAATFSRDPSAYQLWSVTTGRLLAVIPVKEGGNFNASFSPNGKHLLVTGWKDGFELWCPPTRSETPASRPIPDLSARLKDRVSINSGKVVIKRKDGADVQLQGHFEGMTSADLSPDGLRFLAVTREGELDLWDTESGRRLVRVANDSGSARFSDDGRFVFDFAKTDRAGKSGTRRLGWRLRGWVSLPRVPIPPGLTNSEWFQATDQEAVREAGEAFLKSLP